MDIITKIISGGQTGADRAGLDAAVELGIPTGGTAPRHYMTENGPDLSLKALGLVESQFTGYSSRTKANVMDSDGTVVFGDVKSAGSRNTIIYCDQAHKPHKENPTALELAGWAIAYGIKTLNVAGNRASKNPKVYNLTKDTIKGAVAICRSVSNPSSTL